jgi:hypothetical protein
MSTRPRWAWTIITLVRVLHMSPTVAAAATRGRGAALVLTPLPASVLNAVGGGMFCAFGAPLKPTPLSASMRNAEGGAAPCALCAARILAPLPASMRSAEGGAAPCALCAARILAPLPASMRHAEGGAAHCALCAVRILAPLPASVRLTSARHRPVYACLSYLCVPQLSVSAACLGITKHHKNRSLM